MHTRTIASGTRRAHAHWFGDTVDAENAFDRDGTGSGRALANRNRQWCSWSRYSQRGFWLPRLAAIDSRGDDAAVRAALESGLRDWTVPRIGRCANTDLLLRAEDASNAFDTDREAPARTVLGGRSRRRGSSSRVRSRACGGGNRTPCSRRMGRDHVGCDLLAPVDASVDEPAIGAIGQTTLGLRTRSRRHLVLADRLLHTERADSTFDADLRLANSAALYERGRRDSDESGSEGDGLKHLAEDRRSKNSGPEEVTFPLLIQSRSASASDLRRHPSGWDREPQS